MKAFFPRRVIQKVSHYLKQNSIVILEGPIASGKTTFVLQSFPEFEYVSLKNKTHQKLLKNDPLRFFTVFSNKAIFDDIEEVSDFVNLISAYSLSIYQLGNYILLSNICTALDSEIIAKISFFPFDFQENKQAKRLAFSLEENCIKSSFPENISYKNYQKVVFDTLLPKIVHVQEPKKLSVLLKLCSENVNKPLNINDFAKKLNVTQPTVASWLSAFEDLGLIYFLKALNEDFGKRTIKSSKLYFWDNGLLAYLLNIKTSEKLALDSHFFDLYCNLIITEFHKKNALEIQAKELFYWKESNGHEVKLLLKNPTSFDIYEITSSHEILKKELKELDYFDEISDGKVLSKNIVFGGYKSVFKNGVNGLTWQMN